MIFIKKYDIIYIESKGKEMINMDKNELVRKAFLKACKYLREHPPANAGWNGDMEIIQLVVDAKSDPEGRRWMRYFLNEVLKEEDK